MNAEEFFKLTVKVRALRKSYLETKDKVTLVQCRMMETELDSEINRVLRIKGWTAEQLIKEDETIIINRN